MSNLFKQINYDSMAESDIKQTEDLTNISQDPTSTDRKLGNQLHLQTPDSQTIMKKKDQYYGLAEDTQEGITDATRFSALSGGTNQPNTTMGDHETSRAQPLVGQNNNSDVGKEAQSNNLVQTSSNTYVENTRLHTDGVTDNSMAEEDLGVTVDSSSTARSSVSGVSKLTSISLKSNLPVLKLNVPLSLGTSDIFEVFSSVCRKEKFQVIEMEQTIATAVNKEPFSLKRMFMRCFPFADQPKGNQMVENSPISAIRLQIMVNDIKGCRKVALKGLYGDNDLLKEFVASFRVKMHALVKQDSSMTEETRKKKRKANSKRLTQMADSDEEENELRVGMYTETSSVYQIHKILSSDQYTVGKQIQEYLEFFSTQYKNLKESADLLPQPMEGILGVTNETVTSFNSEYNLGKEMGKDLLHYCRPAVERYVFGKLYDQLFAMYAIKNEEMDKLFVERSQKIKVKDAEGVMDYLGINQKFFVKKPKQRKSILGLFSSSKKKDDSSNPFGDESIEEQKGEYVQNDDNSSVLEGEIEQPVGISQDRNQLPYIDAIREIEKIQTYQSPQDMVSCLSSAFGALKSTVVDVHKGKFELSAMDDVLPLTIYVVAMADLQHPASHYNMMDDYLRCNERGYELEKKLLCNFDCGIRYVNNDWELE